MKTRKNYSVDEVLRDLSRKHDVKVFGNTIQVLNQYATNKINDLGNKSWGKIDFLKNFNGFRLLFVEKFDAKNIF